MQFRFGTNSNRKKFDKMKSTTLLPNRPLSQRWELAYCILEQFYEYL